MENNYYVDLNIIYAFFDYLSPQIVYDDQKDLENRKESILNFINTTRNPRFLITKSVYIEWFQKMIEDKWDKDTSTFNKFTKSDVFKEIVTKFRKAHKFIMNNQSIFSFDWKFKTFIAPKKQTWDHFHITMRSKKYKFLTFDKHFSSNRKDFIFLRK